MSKREAVKHHYFPKFHLNRWKSADGKLYVYQKQGSGSVKQSEKDAAQICFQNKLYTLGPDPLGFEYENPDFVESEFLSKIDNDAAVVLDKMLVSSTFDELTEENRRAWARYIISLLERHPDRIKYSEQLHKEVGDEIIAEKLLRTTNEEKREIEKCKKMIDEVLYYKTQARAFLINLINDSEWIESLLAFKWRLINIDRTQGFHFIVTEAPVFLYKQDSRIYIVAVALDPNNLWVAYLNGWEDDHEILELIKAIAMFYNADLVHKNPEFVVSDRPLSSDKLYQYDNVLQKSLKNVFVNMID